MLSRRMNNISTADYVPIHDKPTSGLRTLIRAMPSNTGTVSVIDTRDTDADGITLAAGEYLPDLKTQPEHLAVKASGANQSIEWGAE